MSSAAPQPSRRLALLDRLAVLWAIVCAAGLFVTFRGHGFDDPFITYRYAANLAAGAGFVYNAGERVLSTTAPLYGLLLAPAAALGLDVPTASNLTGAASLGLGALAFWRLGRMAGMPVAGGFGLITYPLLPGLAVTLGAETALFIALTLWGMAALAGRPGLAGALLGAATLTRADGALGAAICGAALLWRRERGALLRFCGWYLLVVAPFALAAWAYYGSPIPVTLGAKRSQGRIPGSRSYLEGLIAQVGGLAGRPLYWPLLGLATLGLATLRRPAVTALPLAWGAAHALAYSLLGVTAYFWYYGPALTGLVAAAALGAELLARRVRPRAAPGLGAGIAAGLALALAAGQLGALGYVARNPDQRLGPYQAAGEWLRANTPPGARAAMLEVGIVGFYGQRPIVDFAGLIQPELAAVFRAGQSYDAAARLAVATYRPDYIVNQEATLPLVTADPALAARCRAVAAIPDPRHGTPLAIYRCAWATP
jgi:hypothetical protein